MDIIIQALIYVSIGAATSTVYAFLWKLPTNPELAFDSRFWVSMLASILMTLMLVPQIVIGLTIPPGSDSFVQLFLFLAGFSANVAINKPVAFTIKNTKLLKELLEKKANEPK